MPAEKSMLPIKEVMPKSLCKPELLGLLGGFICVPMHAQTADGFCSYRASEIGIDGSLNGLGDPACRSGNLVGASHQFAEAFPT